MFFVSLLLSPRLYLDPGSGSILMQMILAVLLGGGILVRSQWKRIKGWFGVKTEDSDPDSDDESEEK